MAFDGIFLHLIKNEIASKVVGFRVDKIYQPSKEEILFTFRTYDGSEKLLLSAKADSSRIQLTNQYIENPKNLLCSQCFFASSFAVRFFGKSSRKVLREYSHLCLMQK